MFKDRKPLLGRRSKNQWAVGHSKCFVLTRSCLSLIPSQKDESTYELFTRNWYQARDWIIARFRNGQPRCFRMDSEMAHRSGGRWLMPTHLVALNSVWLPEFKARRQSAKDNPEPSKGKLYIARWWRNRNQERCTGGSEDHDHGDHRPNHNHKTAAHIGVK